jgi:hypothetical protein
MDHFPFKAGAETDQPSRPPARQRRAARIAVVVCALLFCIGWWIPSSSGQRPLDRWNPRRAPANAEFVGDTVCADCHTDIVAAHAKSSMAQAMEPIPTSKVLVANPLMTFRSGPYLYEIRRKGNESIYAVTDGKETISLPILYAFGQGKAGQTYLLQHEGVFLESLVSYYKQVGGLDWTMGAPRTVPKSLKAAIGRPLSDNETMNCFSCHSAGAVRGGKLDLSKLTQGIRCESCHGPGGSHVTAVNEGKPSARFVFNPKILSGDELTQDFCASCHRGTDEFSLLKGMEINNVRFQPYRMFFSKCYSDDRRISCTACHDPHEPLKQEAAYYDAKCAACHSTGKTSPRDAKAAELIPGCTVGTKDCASCHMPKIGPPAAHFDFTDHYIRIVRPREAYPN